MADTPSGTANPLGIEAYGAGGFRIGGQRFRGSVLVLPDGVHQWPVAEMPQLTLESLAPLMAVAGVVEILLLGCGAQMAMVPTALRQSLRDTGIVVDAMDTGAACRTYNVLRAEGRQVAAALIAVG
jgi:uncharacterized protein